MPDLASDEDGAQGFRPQRAAPANACAGELDRCAVHPFSAAQSQAESFERQLVIACEIADSCHVEGIGGRERPVGGPTFVEDVERLLWLALHRERERPGAMTFIGEV